MSARSACAVGVIAFLAAAPALAQRVGAPPEPYALDLRRSPTDDAGRAWFEAKVAPCFRRLAGALDAAGYSHDLAIEWTLSDPSLVDATNARAAQNGRDVTLLTDGSRIHVVAPFVTYRRARALDLQTRAVSSDSYARVCAYVRTIEFDTQLRRSQRLILAAIAACGLALSAAITLWWSRRPSAL